MPRYEFTMQRLFVSDKLHTGALVFTDRAQANYLLNVLRLADGDAVLLFNGVDGEWRAAVRPEGRKKAILEIVEQTRTQPAPSDLHLLFAPLKQGRLDYLVQKGVEMGAGRIVPVLTEYTQSRNVRADKMEAYATEASEQCGILNVPEIGEVVSLKNAIPPDRQIIFCDENFETFNPLPTLEGLKLGALSVLIGPEGGFSGEERAWLNSHDNVTAIPLGPRILRADTAAVAALAVVQAVLGDWR